MPSQANKATSQVPDPTSLGLRFLAELFISLVLKVVGGITRMVRASRTKELADLFLAPVNGGEFLTAPLSTVWLVLSTSFAIEKSEVLHIDMSAGAYGEWIIRVVTAHGPYEAIVGRGGLLVSVRLAKKHDGT